MISVRTGATIIQAVTDATLDISLVQFSVMRENFLNLLTITGWNQMEAGMVMNEIIMVNGRSFKETFSVIQDRNLEPFMVLGRKAIAEISQNKDKKDNNMVDNSLTETKETGDNPAEAENNAREPVEAIGNGYHMANLSWNVWNIHIKIGGTPVWAVLDPYSQLSYIQNEVRKRLLKQIRMDTNHEAAAPGTIGVLKDIDIIKKRITKADLRVIKQGFASSPVKLGLDWLERNKIGVQGYKGQNHLFFLKAAAVSNYTSNMVPHQETAVEEINNCETQWKQEITARRAARKEQKRIRKTQARERKEKREGKHAEREGIVKAGFGATGHPIQQQPNQHRYIEDRDLWEKALERERVGIGAQAIIVRIGWIEIMALLEPTWPQSYISEEIVKEWRMQQNKKTHLVEAKHKEHVVTIMEGQQMSLWVHNEKTGAVVRIWELGKMELDRHNFQNLQDIRVVNWEEMNQAYLREKPESQQYWTRPEMEKILVGTQDGYCVWAVLDETREENLVRYSIAHWHFGKRIHPVSESTMVAGVVIGRRAVKQLDKLRQAPPETENPNRERWEENHKGTREEESGTSRAENTEPRQEQDPHGTNNVQRIRQGTGKMKGDMTYLLDNRTTSEIEQEEDNKKSSRLNEESDIWTEEEILGTLDQSISQGREPMIAVRTAEGDCLLVVLNPRWDNNYCSKEIVKLLNMQEQMDDKGQPYIEETIIVTPEIGMQVKMKVKEQEKLPAKLVLGAKWIKAYENWRNGRIKIDKWR
ncbi:hypothetical protein C8J56DRAFT_890573 [Mycena floridula]|nr:hypothetical protein C8J56DRAFT_890573 [Mycena floridula]